jgi:hypothetical protein
MSQLDGKSYAPLLHHVLFEQQSSFFVMTMQSNSEVAIMKPPHDYNLTTQMWRRFVSTMILKYRIFEYFKFVKLGICVVLRNV